MRSIVCSGRAGQVARRVLVGAILVGTVALFSPAVGASGGAVLPASATPYGYSLADMTRQIALFSTSGNNPAYYPHTPFQILSVDPATVVTEQDGCGILSTGTNSFVVHSGKSFFVPLQFVDDSPPVLGTWPTTHSQAVPYFFDSSQLGGRGFGVDVDGQTTDLRAPYLAGPVTTPPLLDGGGTHMLTLGAFLRAMSPGKHTVTISGGVFGALIQQVYGVCSARFRLTYTVNVQRDE